MGFSDWDAESELSQFSGVHILVSLFLYRRIAQHPLFSQSLALKSDGAFDVTVGPLSRLWRIARHQKSF